MRADRLVATLLLMQARGRVTARELASELEVSVATACRDLVALSAAGLPVYPQSGRGGGWRLLGEGRTDLSGLSESEIQSLFLLVGPAARSDRGAKAALRKLVRALPETFRAQAEAAADATVIHSDAWGARDSGSPGADDIAATLQQAVVRRRRIEFRYTGWNRPPAEESVDPWRVVFTGTATYLLGAQDGRARAFRADRIEDLRIVDEPAPRPGIAEIDAAWDEVVAAVQEQTARASVTLRTAPGTIPWLRALFGAWHVHFDRERDTVTITAPTIEMIARQLAGWADKIDVLDPPEVRAEMHRIGVIAADRNRSRSS